MFSDALRIMDRNTVWYMIDEEKQAREKAEMRAGAAEQERDKEKQRAETAEQKLSKQHKELDKKRTENRKAI